MCSVSETNKDSSIIFLLLPVLIYGDFCIHYLISQEKHKSSKWTMCIFEQRNWTVVDSTVSRFKERKEYVLWPVSSKKTAYPSLHQGLPLARTAWGKLAPWDGPGRSSTDSVEMLRRTWVESYTGHFCSARKGPGQAHDRAGKSSDGAHCWLQDGHTFTELYCSCFPHSVISPFKMKFHLH